MAKISLTAFGSGVYVIDRSGMPAKAQHNANKKFKYEADENEILFQINNTDKEIKVVLGSSMTSAQINALVQYCIVNGNKLPMRILTCGLNILREADKHIQAYNLIVSA